MTASDYATVSVAVIAIVSAFAGAVRWLVKHYLAELKPNGGGSMRDSVNRNSERLERLEAKQDSQGERIDRIFELLCEQKGR